MKNKFLIISLAVLIAAVLAACNPGTTDDNMTYDGGGDTAEPDITGEILDVQNENALRVLVDSDSEQIKGQIWVTVKEETEFVDSEGLKAQPDDIESLFVVGEHAAFLSDGTILESYPMQTSAQIAFTK